MSTNPIKLSKVLNSQINQSNHHDEYDNDQAEEGEENDEDISLKDLDLDHIYSLRTQSIKAFQSNLQSIYSKYEGDGDEEADDVVDLVNLKVIEDRGQIIKTLGSRLDNLRHQRHCNSSRTKESKKQSNHFQTDSTIPSDTTCSDEEADWIDDEIVSVSSSSDSIIFPPQPSSSTSWVSTTRSFSSPLKTSKITLTSERINLPSPSKLSTFQSFQHIHGTATNALFERLKQRVQEKSLDLRQLRNKKKARETSQESEASSQLYTKLSSRSSICSPPTLASDIVTDSSSEPWKDSKSSSTYRTAPSESSSRHSLCSSPITPRYSKPHQNPLGNPLLPISALKFSANKRSRPAFESRLPTPTTITNPRQPRPGPSRLKNEVNIRSNPKDSHRPNPIPSRIKALNSNGSHSSPSRPLKSLPRSNKRSTTWIDPKPIPVNQSSRESSEDPLCLPPTPSRRRSEAKTKPNKFQINIIPKPQFEVNCKPKVIEISSDDDDDDDHDHDQTIEAVKDSLDGFGFSSSPCRKRPRRMNEGK